MKKKLKWSQQAALEIYKDGSKNGWPTDKGVKELVLGLWAKMIDKAAKDG